MLSKLYMEIINNPDQIKPYRNLIDHYLKINKQEEASAFLYLIEKKFNDNNPDISQK